MNHGTPTGERASDREPASREPVSGSRISDDTELLDLMVGDAGQSGPLWTATAYWRGYSRRIMEEIARSGLADVRTNQHLLKGFALGGMKIPAMPRNDLKRRVWRLLEGAPGVRQMLAAHRHLLTAEYEQHKRVRRSHAALVMDRIADAFPGLQPPRGLANGGADDAFEWRGHTLVPAFVMYLSRIADFYGKVDTRKVQSIIEIGPGLGLGSLAHKTLNPELKLVVNVDIAPILYLSTQFLKSVEGVDVVDYRATRTLDEIAPVATDKALRIYQIAPWQVPRLAGSFDFFFNAFSFQEMEVGICRNYANEINRLVENGVMLHSMAAGHKPGVGGQQAPVTLDFLEGLFEGKFPDVDRPEGFWTRYFDGSTEMVRLMTR